MKFPENIRIAIVPNIGIFEINSTVKDHIQVIGGLESKFLEFLSFGLKFKYTLKVPEDLEWGRQISNGTWTGLMGLVQDNVTDIAFSKMGVNFERSIAVDFVYPYNVEYFTFATKSPGILSNTAAIFLPFTAYVWLSMFIVFLLLFLVFQFLLSKDCMLRNNALNFIGTILQQSQDVKCGKLHEKTLVASFMLTAMILGYSYKAVLLSFLTVPLKEKTIENTRQLSNALDSNRYKCVAIAGSTLLKLLLSSTDDDVQNIAKHIEKNNWLISPQVEVIADTLEVGNTAVITLKSDFRRIPENKLYFPRDSITYVFLSIAVNKQFCCKAALDTLIHRITAAGLYHKSTSDYYLQSLLHDRQGPIEPSVVTKSLTLVDVLGSLLFLLGGYVLSILVLIIEMMLGNTRIRI